MSTSAERMRALRARRGAALEAGPDDEPRDPADLLAPSVGEALAALELDPKDSAAAQLATIYARVIDRAKDHAWAARWIGPLLLQALAELHATPASRMAATGKQPASRAPSKVAQLRHAHAAATRKRPA